jgi:hypothetical protein
MKNLSTCLLIFLIATSSFAADKLPLLQRPGAQAGPCISGVIVSTVRAQDHTLFVCRRLELNTQFDGLELLEPLWVSMVSNKSRFASEIVNLGDLTRPEVGFIRFKTSDKKITLFASLSNISLGLKGKQKDREFVSVDVTCVEKSCEPSSVDCILKKRESCEVERAKCLLDKNQIKTFKAHYKKHLFKKTTGTDEQEYMEELQVADESLRAANCYSKYLAPEN